MISLPFFELSMYSSFLISFIFLMDLVQMGHSLSSQIIIRTLSGVSLSEWNNGCVIFLLSINTLKMRNRHTFCIGDFSVKLNEVEMVYPPFWVKNYISFSKGIKGGNWNIGVF